VLARRRQQIPRTVDRVAGGTRHHYPARSRTDEGIDEHLLAFRVADQSEPDPADIDELTDGFEADDAPARESLA
jgi:hypothetical protein